MDGIKTAMQQINELSKKVDSGDENLQNQINELPKKIDSGDTSLQYQINQLFNRLKQLEETNKSLQNRKPEKEKG